MRAFHLALAATLLAASAVRAHVASDFTPLAPGITVRLVYQASADSAWTDSDSGTLVVGNGGLLLRDRTDPTYSVISVLGRDGSVTPMLRVRNVSADGYGCYGTYMGHSDPVTGVLWLIAEGGAGPGRQYWLVEGLPRTNSSGTCPAPGDLAPVIRDGSTAPPTAHLVGDGHVDVADAIVVLRAAVGLEQLACGP